VLYCAAPIGVGYSWVVAANSSVTPLGRYALLTALPFRVKISDRLHGVGAAANDSGSHDSGGAASAMSDRSELTAS
jgi:hypothetical protein